MKTWFACDPAPSTLVANTVTLIPLNWEQFDVDISNVCVQYLLSHEEGEIVAKLQGTPELSV